MKKLLLALALFGAFALIQAQQSGEDDYYTAHNDENTADGTASEIVGADPIAITEFSGNVDPAVQEASGSTPDMDLTASAEGSFSTYTSKITIPLWYRWRDFSFNASVPYIIKKELPVGGETFEASGIGDISIGVSYGKYLENYNTYLSVNTMVKLPTGDEKNSEESSYGFEQLIPLGTGSTDIALGLAGYYFMDAFTFKGNLLYKMNGECDYPYAYWNGTETIDDPTQDIGDLFVFTAGADYRWQYRLTFGMDIVYGSIMPSEIEGDDQKDGMQYLDIMPNAKYAISLFEFVLGVKVPVYTELETYQTWISKSDQKQRNIEIRFRTNYRIF